MSSYQQPSVDNLGPLLQQVLSNVVGDPALTQQLTNLLQPIATNLLRGRVEGMGGFSLAGAPYYLNGRNFGINPGIHAYHSMNTTFMDNLMSGSRSVMDEQLRIQNARIHTNIFGLSPEEAASASSGFGITNFLSKMQFNTHKPLELLQGIEEASRYLGAAPAIGLGEEETILQTRLNERAKTIGSTIVSDYFTNMEEYEGFTGKEVGQITAELSRTGQYTGDIEQAKQATRGMAKTIKSLQEFFDGDVMDLIDQANALTGTNYQSSMGDLSSDILRKLAGTGFATGHTNRQLVALSNMSAQISNQIGTDSFGAFSNAQDTALLLGTMRIAGGDDKFSNEVATRNAITTQVTKAQQSVLARNISGAYAYLIASGKTDEEANEFVKSLNGRGVNLTNDEIVRELRAKTGNEDISTATIQNLSNTNTAMRFRSSGAATDIALGATLDSFDKSRRQNLKDILQNRGKDTSIVDSIEGAITVDSIRSALQEKNYSNIEIEETIGKFIGNDNKSAQAMGLGTGTRDADRIIKSYNATAEKSRLMGQAEFRVALSDITSGKGAIGGLRALSKALTDPKSTDSVGSFIKTILGDVDVDMSALAADVEQVATLDGADPAMLQEGLYRAYSGLITGQLTEEQAVKANKIIREKDPAKRLENIESFLEEVSPEEYGRIKREKVINELKQGSFKDTKVEDVDLEKRAKTILSLERTADIQDFVSIEGDEKEGPEYAAEREKANRIRNVAKARADYLRNNTMDLEEAATEFWKTEKMSRDEFEGFQKKEANMREKNGGGASNRMADALDEILSLMKYKLGNRP
jgi:hypothetical protein